MFAVRGIGPIQTTLQAAMLALAVGAAPAVAQAPRNDATATVGACTNSSTAPGSMLTSAACAVAGGSANAQVTPGLGGGVTAHAQVATGGSANVNASLLDWYTIGSGPISNIFRFVLASSVVEAQSDDPATSTSAELFAGPLVDDGLQVPWRGTSFNSTFSLFPNLTSTFLIDVPAALLPTTHRFAFGLLANIFMQGVTENSEAFVRMSTPTLTLFDAEGNDITDEFEISLQSSRDRAGEPTTATPEPASMALMATGLVGMGASAIRRRRSRKS